MQKKINFLLLENRSVTGALSFDGRGGIGLVSSVTSVACIVHDQRRSSLEIKLFPDKALKINNVLKIELQDSGKQYARCIPYNCLQKSRLPRRNKYVVNNNKKGLKEQIQD